MFLSNVYTLLYKKVEFTLECAQILRYVYKGKNDNDNNKKESKKHDHLVDLVSQH